MENSKIGKRIRKPHYLSLNAKLEKYQRIVFFDTETNQSEIENGVLEHTLRLGVCIYRQRDKGKSKPKREVFYFDTLKDFWEWIISHTANHKTLNVVAHNLRFDIGVLRRFEYLIENGWVCKSYIEDSAKTLIVFAKGKSRIKFIDNMNLFNSSLERIGRNIGFTKFRMPEPTEPDSAWYVYCHRDVEVMERSWDLLEHFIDEHNLGNFQNTISKLAFSAYRHRFMQQKIAIHVHQSTIDLERASYCGGRCEAFRIGEFRGENFYYVDINSLYSFIMKSGKFPYELLYYTDNVRVGDLGDLLKKYSVIADVEVQTNEPVFVLKHEGRSIYPIGRFRTCLSSSELKYALRHKYLLKVHRCCVYKQDNIFFNFIDYFYTLRKQYKENGNTTYEQFCKLLMNSLYGKFGQKNKTWKIIAEIDDLIPSMFLVYDYETGKQYTQRIHDGIVEEEDGYVEGINSMVAIASEVTAQARMYVWNLIRKIGRENIYVMDTDGFFVGERGYERIKDLIDEKELGKFKVEGNKNYLKVNGKKDYIWGNEKVTKGIKETAVQIGENTFMQWQNVPRYSKLDIKYPNRCIWKAQIKELSKDYKSGVILPNGKVKPLIFKIDAEGNTIDFGKMLDAYGKYALYDGKELEVISIGDKM